MSGLLELPGGATLTLEPGRPRIMGIVNANPDSFSDAVRLRTLDDQVGHALALVEQGADIIDVGGESGVTNTAVTAPQAEIERVVPLVERLVARGILVSIDTWKPKVAGAAVDAGAAIINDVSGLADPRLAAIAAQSGAALVVMHTRATPKQVGFADYGGDVVGDVERFLRERLEVARAAGVGERSLIVDPGPDFAKTPAESVLVLQQLERIVAIGPPLLLPVSRKYFVGAITGREPPQRLAGTLAALAHGVARGAAIVRVHDVAAVADFLAVQRVMDGADPMPDFDAADERLKWIPAAPD